jgi:hypothetical protein
MNDHDGRERVEPERYVTAQQLADRMGVSVSTIKRLTRAGMPSESWGLARTRRYLPSQAIAWAIERGARREYLRLTQRL